MRGRLGRAAARYLPALSGYHRVSSQPPFIAVINPHFLQRVKVNPRVNYLGRSTNNSQLISQPENAARPFLGTQFPVILRAPSTPK